MKMNKINIVFLFINILNLLINMQKILLDVLKNIDNMILYKVLKEVVYYLYGDLDILNIFFF